ncbi:MAG: prepilin-type N-terminal cleavage/methylation domain-containing protein [Clostridia bacterium]|nr:prepilin-type N-terminal cleavage/methylation domain-containing protein [Clostridia bacterium]
MRSTKKGFTLVELLVVIAILAILATVSVVGYTAFIEKAHQSVAMQEMTQIRNALVAEDIINNYFNLEDGISGEGIETVYADEGDPVGGQSEAFYVLEFVKELGIAGTFEVSEGKLLFSPAGKDATATCDFVTGEISTAKGALEDNDQSTEPVVCPHTNVTATGTDATCTEPGFTTSTCDDCGEIVFNQEIPATGHDWADADCDTPKTCTVCGATDGEALGHDEVEHEAQAPTCTTIGWDAYVTCTRCDYTTYVEKSATGHTPNEDDDDCTTAVTCQNCDHVFVEAKEHVAPDTGILDCTVDIECANDGCDYVIREGNDNHTPGADDGDCTTPIYCSNEYCDQIAVEAKEHVAGGAVRENEVDATCTTAGSYDSVVYCTACNAEISRTPETIPATGHTLGEDDKCANCGIPCQKVTISFADVANRTEFSATKQVWEQNGIVVTNNKASSTTNVADYSNPARFYKGSELIISYVQIEKIVFNCKEGAADLNSCLSDATTNGETVTATFSDSPDSVSIDLTAGKVFIYTIEVYTFYVCPHENTSTSEVPPTCTEAGYTITTCDFCGTELSRIDGEPATGHTVVVDEAVEAGCTSTGLTEGKHCDVCGETLEKQEVVDATGHDYVDGKCSVCQAIEPSEEQIGLLATFTMGEDGNATHVDGSSDKASYSETVGEYTLNLTGASKMYPDSIDAKGNGALKLGASSAAGKFTLTVGDNITKVVIHIAGYKNNTAKVTINGTTHTISTLSNNGEYEAIEIDTTANKTITFTTASGGWRAMVNTIEFYGVGGSTTPDSGEGEGGETPDIGEGGGTADLNTLSTSTSYGKSTTEDGWVATNSAVLKGGTSNASPVFSCIGTEEDFAVCLNGKTSAKGSLVSPTLSGGISKLTFNWTAVFGDSKLGGTITIKDTQGNTLATYTFGSNSVTKFNVQAETWELETPIAGDFTIEIVNNCPSNNNSNGDRLAIWNITWEGYAE